MADLEGITSMLVLEELYINFLKTGKIAAKRCDLNFE